MRKTLAYTDLSLPGRMRRFFCTVNRAKVRDCPESAGGCELDIPDGRQFHRTVGVNEVYQITAYVKKL